MLNRLLISQRIPAPFFRVTMSARLLAFALALIFTACTHQPAHGMTPAGTTKMSQGQSLQVSQNAQLSTALGTAIEQVANKAIPAVVHIVVKEKQELANPFYAYKDNPLDYGLPLQEGVAIQWIDPKGPMGEAGFEVGDIIVGLDDHPVQGVDSFNELMTAMPHHQKAVLLAIDHKSGQSGYVQVEIS